MYILLLDHVSKVMKLSMLIVVKIFAWNSSHTSAMILSEKYFKIQRICALLGGVFKINVL